MTEYFRILMNGGTETMTEFFPPCFLASLDISLKFVYIRLLTFYKVNTGSLIPRIFCIA